MYTARSAILVNCSVRSPESLRVVLDDQQSLNCNVAAPPFPCICTPRYYAHRNLLKRPVLALF